MLQSPEPEQDAAAVIDSQCDLGVFLPSISLALILQIIPSNNTFLG